MDDKLPVGSSLVSPSGVQNQQGDLNQNQTGRVTPVVDFSVTGASPADKGKVLSGQEENKEGGLVFKEGEPVGGEKKEYQLPPEVEKWVEEIKTAEEITLPQPIKDDFGQILLEAANPTPPTIVLPLSQQKTQSALKKKITDSIRWLAEWCLRLIKMFPKRVVYGSDQ